MSARDQLPSIIYTVFEGVFERKCAGLFIIMVCTFATACSIFYSYFQQNFLSNKWLVSRIKTVSYSSAKKLTRILFIFCGAEQTNTCMGLTFILMYSRPQSDRAPPPPSFKRLIEFCVILFLALRKEFLQRIFYT